ncbi:hypothetical protein Tco_1171628, partial [Tanacetum coccineum]
MKSSMG